MLKRFRKVLSVFCLITMMTTGFAGVFSAVAVSNAHAQAGAVGEEVIQGGPLEMFRKRIVKFFQEVRNWIYIMAAFVLIWMAKGWVSKGEIEWDKLLMMVLALIIIAFAGLLVKYASRNTAGTDNGLGNSQQVR